MIPCFLLAASASLRLGPLEVLNISLAASVFPGRTGIANMTSAMFFMARFQVDKSSRLPRSTGLLVGPPNKEEIPELAIVRVKKGDEPINGLILLY